ncbi:hypothetical protein HO415_10850 [Streptococcus suis]|nr:hypothetical protein [Streptococcus suis]
MKKIVSLLLSVVLLNIVCPVVVFAEDIFDYGNSSTAIIEAPEVVQDIETIDNNHFKFITSEGNISDIFVNDQGDVYVDGKLEMTHQQALLMFEIRKSVSNIGTERSSATWYYLDTYSYDIDFQNRTKSVMLGVISLLVPILSPAIGIGGILDDLFSQKAPGMYITVNRYYKAGYQYYKYVYHFYSDANRKQHVAMREEIKKMW